MKFSTSKFCNERKREREGKKKRAQSRKERSLEPSGRAGFIVWDFFQELVPIPPGSGQPRQQQQSPRSAGSDAGRGGRSGGRARRSRRGRRRRLQPETAPRASSARETCARAPSLTPASPCSPPTPPPPSPLPRAPRHPRALARAPPRAHTWSARGKVSPAIAAPESCRSARGCNLELSRRGDTVSSLSLPRSPLRPPPRLFLKKHFTTNHHPNPTHTEPSRTP